MYNLSVSPQNVHQTLSSLVLTDGFDITYDIEKSQGVYIYDSKYNRKMLDFFTCFASVPLGYNHPKMMQDEEFKKHLFLAALANPSNSDVYTVQYAKFVETFKRLAMPSYFKHAFFIAGGGLAIENALKTAMDWKVQKNFAKGYQQEKGFKVIHFEQAFHGRTGYTLSLTNGSPVKVKWFAKFDWPRISNPKVHFPLDAHSLNDVTQRETIAINQIKQAFADNKDDVCAIIIESIQAEGGDNHFRKEFMEQLRILADENEALLIYDEVQTGVGLSGKFWAYEHFGEKARPDIVAFGKKMQICGIMVNERVDENKDNVFTVSSRLNSTWGGSLADMVRATKILEIVDEDNLCQNAQTMGDYLQQELQKVANKFDKVREVRGKGLITAFDFPTTEMRNKFIEKGIEHDVMFLGCGSQTIRFRPALIIQKEDIDKGMAVMEAILPSL